MEPWFLSAVGGAVFAGVSNFYFKIAAKKDYDSHLFTLWGGISSVVISGITFTFFELNSFENSLFIFFCIHGRLASFGREYS